MVERSGGRAKKRGGVLPRLTASVPSILFWVAVALFDRSMQTAAALLAALLHELGHIAVILLCGMRITGITVLPYGLEMTTDRPPCSFYEDIAINAAGCVVNLLSFPIFYGFGAVIRGDLSDFTLLLAVASFTLGVLNAFPIISLDGGCVLEALLSLFLDSNTAYLVLKSVSFVFLLVLWVFATYVFLFSGYNYSLFAMALWLFARVFCGRQAPAGN